MARRRFIQLVAGMGVGFAVNRLARARAGLVGGDGGCDVFSSGFEDAPRRAVAAPRFADRTHTVDANAVGNGDGTDQRPWTLSQALNLAQPGMVIGVRAGVYIGRAQSANSNAFRYTPAFRTALSGTAAAPIYLVAEHLAALDLGPTSELRSGSTVVGGGWPAFGNYQRDHVWWIGFASDEAAADNKPCNDSAPAVLWSSTGGGFIHCDLRGVDVGFQDNHSGIRCEDSSGFLVSDCRIGGFRRGGGSSVNQAGVMTYRCRDAHFVHNQISDCGNALFWKASSPQWGLHARFNVFADCDDMMRIMLLEATARSTISQNLFIRYRTSAIYLSDLAVGGAVPQELYVCNNLFVQRSAVAGNLGTFRYDKPAYAASNKVYNNIVFDTQGAPVISSDFNRDVSTLLSYVEHQYNCYFGHGPFGGSEGGSGSLRDLTLGAWVQTYGMDVAGVFADPRLENVAARDFRLRADSPCRLAGRDILQLLGGGVNQPIHMGPVISECAVPSFGVRS